MSRTVEFSLSGLRASNPLAFLAALGALRVAAGAFGHDAVHMRWRAGDEGWSPLLRLAADKHLDEFLLADELHAWLQTTSGRKAFAIADDLTLSTAAFRSASQAAAACASPSDRARADFIAAFGCDGVEVFENGKSSGKMADTALRTMSGAGHQHFLGFMRTLAADCTADHLRRTLFAAWRYDDPLESHTLRWDPVDDVRYALRWRDSSGDPDRKRGGAMWGANRLAIEALPLLPTMPLGSRLLGTTGFSSSRHEGTVWTWPVWDGWCSIDVARSLLSLKALQSSSPDRSYLARIGVVDVFRSVRIRQGKYRNLTPARSV